MVRAAFLVTLVIGMAGAQDAVAADAQPGWMLGLSGGSFSRDGYSTEGFGSASLSRRQGKSYVRVSVTRFALEARQLDDRLPSTYTIGFVSGGTTFGNWFVDGYGAAGIQRYHTIRTPFGDRPITGSASSGIYGAGGDLGCARWLGKSWSLTPSASMQYVRSNAIRQQLGGPFPGQYESREKAATFGGTLRLDHYWGADRGSSVGLRVAHYVTTNASAALISGATGASDLANGRQADGWTEFGGSTALRLTRLLYLDLGLSRTMGAAAGDVTTTSAGARILF